MIVICRIKDDEMVGAFNAYEEKINGVENVKEQDHRKN
jgi:translation elongation factor EF-1beta